MVYAHLKFLWANGQHEESLRYLFKFTSSLSRDLVPETERPSSSVNKSKLEDLSHLLARCYFKQGQWQVSLHHDWDERPIKEILHSYWLATHYDPKWYKAWHTWALANFEVVGYLESLTEDRTDIPGDELAVHIVQAVEGWSCAFRTIHTELTVPQDSSDRLLCNGQMRCKIP